MKCEPAHYWATLTLTAPKEMAVTACDWHRHQSECVYECTKSWLSHAWLWLSVMFFVRCGEESTYIPPMIVFAKFITSGFLMYRLVAFSKQRTILLQPLPPLHKMGPILTVWNASEERQAQVALWAVLWRCCDVETDAHSFQTSSLWPNNMA